MRNFQMPLSQTVNPITKVMSIRLRDGWQGVLLPLASLTGWAPDFFMMYPPRTSPPMRKQRRFFLTIFQGCDMLAMFLVLVIAVLLWLYRLGVTAPFMDEVNHD